MCEFEIELKPYRIFAISDKEKYSALGWVIEPSTLLCTGLLKIPCKIHSSKTDFQGRGG